MMKQFISCVNRPFLRYHNLKHLNSAKVPCSKFSASWFVYVLANRPGLVLMLSAPAIWWMAGLVQLEQLLMLKVLRMFPSCLTLQSIHGLSLYISSPFLMISMYMWIYKILIIMGCILISLYNFNRYASSFYGPFREALDSNPRFGDKKTYEFMGYYLCPHSFIF